MEVAQLTLEIQTNWERLEDGSPEERACFGALAIRWNGVALTAGHDLLVHRVRSEPLLSGYHLAEWVAWNWWRLRWEPRSSSEDWAFAHRLATIGAGYVWPNITIFSDGERVAIIAKQTAERPNTVFRYISDVAAVVRANEFETVFTQFIEQIRGQLTAEKVANSNLESIWQDVCSENNDPNQAKRRRLEALLGKDPYTASEELLDRLMTEATELGESATQELAAGSLGSGTTLTKADLISIANSAGYDSTTSQIARLASGSGLPIAGAVPAWRLGAKAAVALRAQERLGSGPISNQKLSEIAGVQVSVLSDLHSNVAMSFVYDETPYKSKVVLRSKWVTGRRFELSRLLGDRVVKTWGGRLFPATQSFTYRQKMQRSFAAEFLSPFEAVVEFLNGDYSEEAQLECANHFQVSEMTIRTLLMNHGKLERDFVEEEPEAATTEAA